MHGYVQRNARPAFFQRLRCFHAEQYPQCADAKRDIVEYLEPVHGGWNSQEQRPHRSAAQLALEKPAAYSQSVRSLRWDFRAECGVAFGEPCDRSSK